MEGTVSNKFRGVHCYREAADKEGNDMIFPGGMCLYYELQYDPISLLHSKFSGFTTLLDAYHRLTFVLVQAKDYLVKKNVI